jgi:hypothetical protein
VDPSAIEMQMRANLERPVPPDWLAQQQPTGTLSLSDLRERIAILTAAGVTRYRDAGVELQFDPEAQKKDGRTEPKTERF